MAISHLKTIKIAHASEEATKVAKETVNGPTNYIIQVCNKKTTPNTTAKTQSQQICYRQIQINTRNLLVITAIFMATMKQYAEKR